MSIEASHIAALEARLHDQAWRLELAGRSDHVLREQIFALERRLGELKAQLEAERKAGGALRDGIAAAITRLRAIEDALFDS